jgi:hypothetical protein
MVLFEVRGHRDVSTNPALGIGRGSPPCFLPGTHLIVPHRNYPNPTLSGAECRHLNVNRFKMFEDMGL